MLDAGLRPAETTRLSWDDLDLARAEIRVVRGKGDRDRVVPITFPIAAALRRDRGPGPWLTYNLHRPLDHITTRQLQRRMAAIGAAIGAHLNPHKLRHTYARTLLDASISLRHIQLLLGHTNLETTAIYLQISHDDLADTLRQRLAAPPQLRLELIA